MPLRRLVDVRLSNVDKKAVVGQAHVSLCNYTDVYYGTTIRSTDGLMAATATADQIRRFQVQAGDVLITKDSETSDDIARPAFIAKSLDNALCGYHLALLRPYSILGSYLYWTLEAIPVNDQFASEANGVTRVGLTVQSIRGVAIPLPPPEVQGLIADFLDSATERIDRVITAKRQLVGLFEEERQAVVAEAALAGVGSTATMADSGESWLGSISEHWGTRRAKYLFREVNQRSKDGSEELLSVSHLTGVTRRADKNITMFKAESYVDHKLCEPGDLVINTMWAWMGALGVSSLAGIVSPSYGVYRPLPNSPLIRGYASAILRTPQIVSEYARRSTGIRASRLRLYPDDFLDVTLPLPSVTEQAQIVDHIEHETRAARNRIAVAQRQIELLQEYRAVLIAHAVTGKLDLSGVDAGIVANTVEENLEHTAMRGST